MAPRQPRPSPRQYAQWHLVAQAEPCSTGLVQHLYSNRIGPSPRNVLYILSGLDAHKLADNHSDCKVEAQRQKSGVQPSDRVSITENQKRSAKNSNDHSTKHSRHRDALPKKPKCYAGKELSHTGISKKQQGNQSR